MTIYRSLVSRDLAGMCKRLYTQLPNKKRAICKDKSTSPKLWCGFLSKTCVKTELGRRIFQLGVRVVSIVIEVDRPYGRKNQNLRTSEIPTRSEAALWL